MLYLHQSKVAQNAFLCLWVTPLPIVLCPLPVGFCLGDGAAATAAGVAHRPPAVPVTAGPMRIRLKWELCIHQITFVPKLTEILYVVQNISVRQLFPCKCSLDLFPYRQPPDVAGGENYSRHSAQTTIKVGSSACQLCR